MSDEPEVPDHETAGRRAFARLAREALEQSKATLCSCCHVRPDHCRNRPENDDKE